MSPTTTAAAHGGAIILNYRNIGDLPATGMLSEKYATNSTKNSDII